MWIRDYKASFSYGNSKMVEAATENYIEMFKEYVNHDVLFLDCDER